MLPLLCPLWEWISPNLDSVKQDVRCNDNHLGRLSGIIVVG